MMWPSFCFLHDQWKYCGHSIQEALDVDIDHSIPFFDLERRHRRDGHDPGIVNDRASIRPCLSTAPLTQCLFFRHLRALSHPSWKPRALPPLPVMYLTGGIDPIFAPRSEHDFRAIPCQKAGCGFANTAAGPGNYYNFVSDIWHFHSLFFFLMRIRLLYFKMRSNRNPSPKGRGRPALASAISPGQLRKSQHASRKRSGTRQRPGALPLSSHHTL